MDCGIKKLTNYKIVQETTGKKLEEKINELITHGWKPLGGPLVTGQKISQALIYEVNI